MPTQTDLLTQKSKAKYHKKKQNEENRAINEFLQNTLAISKEMVFVISKKHKAPARKRKLNKAKQKRMKMKLRMRRECKRK